MKYVIKCLSAILSCSLLLQLSLFVPRTTEAADILYDDCYTQIARTLHHSSGCTSTQGLAAGETYLYSVMIKSGNTNAVIHRVHRETGASSFMKNSATGTVYFTNLGHANDMDYAIVDGKEYLFVLASGNDIATGNIIVFEIRDDTLYQKAQYTLSDRGRNFNPSGMAVYKIDSQTVTFVFKWSFHAISMGSISFNAVSGDIPVTVTHTLNSTQLTIDGKPRDFSNFANQGIDICGEYLFATYAGCNLIETVYQSLILGFDLSKGSGTLQPEEDLIFYIESSDYPRAFEIEDCGITSDGKLYFNTNCWLSETDKNHDGVFVLNDFSFHKSSIKGTITTFNPGIPATVQLKQGDTVKYTTVIEATAGQDRTVQSFSLEGVAPGTYDLVCTKPGHLPYTITDVIVGESDLELTKCSKAVANIEPVVGDVNGDGAVDLVDVAVLTSVKNYSLLASQAANPEADITGDGLIDLQDLVVITSSDNYGKVTTVVPFQ